MLLVLVFSCYHLVCSYMCVGRSWRRVEYCAWLWGMCPIALIVGLGIFVQWHSQLLIQHIRFQLKWLFCFSVLLVAASISLYRLPIVAPSAAPKNAYTMDPTMDSKLDLNLDSKVDTNMDQQMWQPNNQQIASTKKVGASKSVSRLFLRSSIQSIIWVKPLIWVAHSIAASVYCFLHVNETIIWNAHLGFHLGCHLGWLFNWRFCLLMDTHVDPPQTLHLTSNPWSHLSEA